jgi:hypothetical protein
MARWIDVCRLWLIWAYTKDRPQAVTSFTVDRCSSVSRPLLAAGLYELSRRQGGARHAYQLRRIGCRHGVLAVARLAQFGLAMVLWAIFWEPLSCGSCCALSYQGEAPDIRSVYRRDVFLSGN